MRLSLHTRVNYCVCSYVLIYKSLRLLYGRTEDVVLIVRFSEELTFEILKGLTLVWKDVAAYTIVACTANCR